MNSFDFLWQLVGTHGSVAENYKAELARIWDEYDLEQQRFIYRTIRDKLLADKFVSYNPVKAIRENAPRRKQKILSFDDYYKRYGTTEEKDGWMKKFLPEERKTIYVKE